MAFTPYFTVGMKNLFSNIAFDLHQTGILLLCPNNFNLASSVRKTLFSKSWSFSRSSLSNFSLALMLFFDSNGFFLAYLPCKSSFLMADACTSSVVRETCRSHHDILGFVEAFLSILQSVLGLKLLGYLGSYFKRFPLLNYFHYIGVAYF